jgi:hypothetical protein
MHGTGDVLGDLLKVAETVKKVAVSVGEEVRGRLPNGSMVHGDLEEIQGDKAIIRDKRGKSWTVDLNTVHPTDELAQTQVVNQRQLREDMARPSYHLTPEQENIQQTLLSLGNATIEELMDVTDTKYNEDTVAVVVRKMREDGHIVDVRRDASGSSRYYVDQPLGTVPDDEGQGVNVARRDEILAWLRATPGWWYDADIAAGLGLNRNAATSIGRTTRTLVMSGELEKRLFEGRRQVRFAGVRPQSS